MSSRTPLHAPMRHRSLFLSDLHLGSRACQADKLLNFLYQHEAHYIYLVGDIFDVWHPRAVHWTRDHERIIDLLRSREQQGVKIVRLPGNHDPVHVEKQNGFAHTDLFTATQKTVIHEGADGRRYLVLHGDCCDFWPLSTHLFSRLGSGIDWCWRRRKEPYRAYAPADPFSAKNPA
ncbi:UDP-2,3-diacylglucosamine diphosphatase [Pantoea sp. LMR881]|uniref:UDP-2,3-diacylglucosamine diphosphatase n=1 Tax=Pantoea sp. LMR881 TaxID=3014336 RepID=UPI003FA72AED